jgi:hypothetical protein
LVLQENNSEDELYELPKSPNSPMNLSPIDDEEAGSFIKKMKQNWNNQAERKENAFMKKRRSVVKKSDIKMMDGDISQSKINIKNQKNELMKNIKTSTQPKIGMLDLRDYFAQQKQTFEFQDQKETEENKSFHEEIAKEEIESEAKFSTKADTILNNNSLM